MKKNTKDTLNSEIQTSSSPAYRSELGYLLLGGTIGATLALLFAPKAGSQFRGDIADASRKGYDAALDTARALNERSGELVHTVKEKAGAVYNFARKGDSGRQDGRGPDTGFQDSVDTERNAGTHLGGYQGRANLG